MKISIIPYLFSVLFFIMFNANTAKAQPKIEYFLSASAPHTHYFEVEMHISNLKQDYTDFKMPVWTPGSYLIREYARHIEGFQAYNEKSEKLKFQKVSKNTWRVESKNAEKTIIKYKVYAFELTVRTSFLDASHGYISPASVFMFLDKHLDKPATLSIQLPKDWTKISTGLPLKKGTTQTFEIPNFDLLVDCPIELGNQEILEFNAAGINHKVAVYGIKDYDRKKMLADMAKIVEASTQIFGENPCKDFLGGDYTFIVHILNRGGGGLEHLNSTVLQMSRSAFGYPEGYLGYLGLVAHEYFHLWNVKRLRPFPLGPFDYENENYTTLLWQAEGFTAYYEEVILRRANLIEPNVFLETITSNINTVENTPGNRIQSAGEASLDAWIKFYRPNENSSNSTISYYSKGAIIGLVLDLDIINQTNGEKNMDDFLKLMYQKYFKQLNRGFTEEEFIKELEAFTGKKYQDFFDKYVNGVETIPYAQFFEPLGVKTENYNPRQGKINIGITVDANKFINGVRRDGAGYLAGLNVNDELISIDEKPVTTNNLESFWAGKKAGDKVQVKLRRDGYIQTIELTLKEDDSIYYRFTPIDQPNELQTKKYNKWQRK